MLCSVYLLNFAELYPYRQFKMLDSNLELTRNSQTHGQFSRASFLYLFFALCYASQNSDLFFRFVVLFTCDSFDLSFWYFV